MLFSGCRVTLLRAGKIGEDTSQRTYGGMRLPAGGGINDGIGGLQSIIFGHFARNGAILS
jgi:hypothetical protein